MEQNYYLNIFQKQTINLKFLFLVLLLGFMVIEEMKNYPKKAKKEQGSYLMFATNGRTQRLWLHNQVLE